MYTGASLDRVWEETIRTVRAEEAEEAKEQEIKVLETVTSIQAVRDEYMKSLLSKVIYDEQYNIIYHRKPSGDLGLYGVVGIFLCWEQA